MTKTCRQREIFDLTALAPFALFITRNCFLDEKDVPFILPSINDPDYSGQLPRLISIEQPVQSDSVKQISVMPSMSETPSTRAVLVVNDPLHRHENATALQYGMECESVDDFDDDDDDDNGATGSVTIRRTTPSPIPSFHTTAESSTSKPLQPRNENEITYPPEEKPTNDKLLNDLDHGSDAIVETYTTDPCSNWTLAPFRELPDLTTFLQRIYMALYCHQIKPRLLNKPCKERHRIIWFAPSPQALWTRNIPPIHLEEQQPVGHVQSPALSDQVGFAHLVTSKLPMSTELTIIAYKARIVVPDVVLEFVQAMLSFNNSQRIILAHKIQRKRKRIQVPWSQHLTVAPSLDVSVASVRRLSAAPCQTNTAKAGELFHTERARLAATSRQNSPAEIPMTPLMVERERPAAEFEAPFPHRTQKYNYEHDEAVEQYTQTAEFELTLIDHSDSGLDSPLGCSHDQVRRQASRLSSEGIHSSGSVFVGPSVASSRASHIFAQEGMNPLDCGIENACHGRVRQPYDFDDDRRTKKRARKEKKKEKEGKKISKMKNARTIEHTDVASAKEENRLARKRAKKEYKEQVRAGKKQKKADRKLSLCTLAGLDPTERGDTIGRRYHDESWKVTPEHSNRTKVYAHATSDDPPKKAAGQYNGYLHPRIKKHIPKNYALRSSATMNRLDEDTTLTHHQHSPSGREINPPPSLSEVHLRSQSCQKVPFGAAIVLPTPKPSKDTRTWSPGHSNREDDPSEMIPGVRPHHSFQPLSEVLLGSKVLPRPRFSQRRPTTTQVTPLVDILPITLLCSECFLGLWSAATAQLASGSWLSSLLPNPEDEVIASAPQLVGRKFLLQDTPLLDEIGVDIETQGRGAIVVCSLAGWTMLDVRAQVRKYVLLTAVGRYESLDIYLCADIEITSSLASDISLFQNSLISSDGDCIARFHTVSTKSLAAVMAHRLLSCGAQPLTCISDVVAKEKVERWVRFLLAFVPCLTVTGALSLLQAAGGGSNSPLSEDGAMLGFQKLLGSKVFLEKCRDEIKAGMPSAHVDLATINQLAIVQLVSLL